MATRPLPAHLQAVDQTARQAEPALRSWFLTFAAALKSGMPLAAIVEALRTGNFTPIASLLMAVPVPSPDVTPVVEQNGQAALLQLADRLPPQQRLALQFTVTDPRYQRIADQIAARLVRDVPASIQQTLASMVGQAYTQGLHPYDFAPQLRAMIGLTQRQATAVSNYWQALTAKGSSQVFADKAAQRYADRLLTQRAVLIARTETIRTANVSRIAGYNDAASRGLVDAATATLVWVTAADERVCPACDELDDVEAPLSDAPFFDGNPPPPLHPDCRCLIDLV
jgi:uncharacterized protein with gpF-like domain